MHPCTHRTRCTHCTHRQSRARCSGLGRAASVYEDAREPRMEGHALQCPPGEGDARACVITIRRAEAAQQTECRANSIGRRRFEPVERQRISSPREQIEDRGREVDASDFGFTMRPQPIASSPQPAHEARPQARCAARPLLRRIGRDALEREAVDTAVGVISGDLHLPRVDDG